MLWNLFNEVKRHWPGLLVISVALMIFGDLSQLAVQVYTMSMVSLVIMFSHITRKSLMPYLKLEESVLRASKSAGGAGLVFLGGCILLSTIIFVTVVK